ncbi:protein phosphatase 2C domain-containing protein [Luteipulveratus sp. YIM 133132]|uniref:Protein phosphatase 2C domain-containing protein n=1 Tax=Luteipulveratus flavus TaxID=3031728 RepID=A0ABT6C4Z9_9MICO|nr:MULTISPECIES: protein phosphatase 2C domain-containing protein [unclassified Luteipulveratus]MDE9364399.1 protein phosphatase 2C domain-containing protein [Luteipulveratus sp. YIM 133132]MDF8263962.1 protein phosphatase 2C domain-containing protein [Luteipulveratus sp. YIM 133296]
MPIALHYAARTDLGLGSKSRNEDSGYAGPDLLILADGMGGHAAGDVASSTVVGELVGLDGENLGADDALHQLGKAVRRANERLRDEMDASDDLEGMGTTLIAMLRTGTKLALANIGDSRAYILRGGTFSQITKDHSFVQALLDEGRISAEEAEHHPQRSLVTRVLTGRDDDIPDLSMREARIGDRYLLCSDGLSDYVAGSTIEGILREGGRPEETADRLVAIALRASTRDNVTVVVADVVDQATPVHNQPQVVGAASARHTAGDRAVDPASAQTPAEKAAALTREANTRANGQQPPTGGGPLLAEESPRSRRSGWLRWAGLGGVVVLALGVAAFVGYRWSQQQFYVGQDRGMVTIYQGVPQDLGPFSLHSVDSKTDIAVTDLPSFYRGKVSDTLSASTKNEAIGIVEDLRTEMVKCQTGAADGSTCTP